MNKISGIYKITNLINGKVYIGSAVNIQKRWRREKQGKEINIYFVRALKKYGIENFKFEILEECEKEKLIEREQYYIDKYYLNKKGKFIKSRGYNINPIAGSTLGYKHTKTTKKMLSESHKGKNIGEKNYWYGKNRTGENGPNFGRHFSDITKRKMSEASKCEKNSQAKLNWNIVNEIRKLWGTRGWKQILLAEKYDLSREAISNIVNNKRWINKNYKVVKSKYYKGKLTEEQVWEIRFWHDPKIKGIKTYLANEFNISYKMVSNIINFKAWK